MALSKNVLKSKLAINRERNLSHNYTEHETIYMRPGILHLSSVGAPGLCSAGVTCPLSISIFLITEGADSLLARDQGCSVIHTLLCLGC